MIIAWFVKTSKIHISGTVYSRILNKDFLKSSFLALSKFGTENGKFRKNNFLLPYLSNRMTSSNRKMFENHDSINWHYHILHVINSVLWCSSYIWIYQKIIFDDGIWVCPQPAVKILIWLQEPGWPGKTQFFQFLISPITNTGLKYPTQVSQSGLCEHGIGRKRLIWTMCLSETVTLPIGSCHMNRP